MELMENATSGDELGEMAMEPFHLDWTALNVNARREKQMGPNTRMHIFKASLRAYFKAINF